MKSYIKYILFVLSSIMIILLIFTYNLNKPTIIGDRVVIEEINNLIIPLDAKNITKNDFSTLSSLVKTDKIASEKVNELSTLADYKEYSHLGHGLGELYQYIKSGNEPICPGHLLAHHFVFKNIGEEYLAKNSYEDAVNSMKSWNKMISLDKNYLESIDYENYTNIFYSALKAENVTEESVYILAEAPCVKS